jgi:hypothetical protein
MAKSKNQFKTSCCSRNDRRAVSNLQPVQLGPGRAPLTHPPITIIIMHTCAGSCAIDGQYFLFASRFDCLSAVSDNYGASMSQVANLLIVDMPPPVRCTGSTHTHTHPHTHTHAPAEKDTQTRQRSIADFGSSVYPLTLNSLSLEPSLSSHPYGPIAGGVFLLRAGWARGQRQVGGGSTQRGRVGTRAIAFATSSCCAEEEAARTHNRTHAARAARGTMRARPR